MEIKKRIKELVPDADEKLGLCVVLRAIGKTNNRNEIVVYTDGDFGERDNDGRFTSAYVKWNLEHDNYDQQSEETRTFIGSLLSVN